MPTKRDSHSERHEAIYCAKCSDEVRASGVEPREILDENRECLLCAEPKVCPNCSGEQGERFEGYHPLLVCMDCIAEADRYLLRIAEVNEDINSSLRLREAQGYIPIEIITDATLQGGGVGHTSLPPGVIVSLDLLPMVFAVGILFQRGKECILDYVALCPVSLKNRFGEALNETGIHIAVREPPRSEGDA